MRIDAEANAAEKAGKIRHEELLAHRGWQFPFLHHEEHVVGAHDVGLCLLHRRVQLFESDGNIDVLRATERLSWTERVTELVKKDLVEERGRGEKLLLRRDEEGLADRLHDSRELRVEHVAEQHLFRAFFLTNALVIRKVEGGRHDAATRVTRAEDEVADANGALKAALGLHRRFDRQVSLHFAEQLLEACEVFRRGGVGNGDERFERRLLTLELVFVSLVGADGHLDGRVEIHPVLVGGVIVVAPERRRAGLEEASERAICFFSCFLRLCSLLSASALAFFLSILLIFCACFWRK